MPADMPVPTRKRALAHLHTRHTPSVGSQQRAFSKNKLLGPSPDLLTQSLHPKKHPRRSVCTLQAEEVKGSRISHTKYVFLATPLQGTFMSIREIPIVKVSFSLYQEEEDG